MGKTNWEQVGNQSKIAREELFNLLKITKQLPPQSTTRIVKAIDQLDMFRHEAEERMLKEDSTKTTKVFYGERK